MRSAGSHHTAEVDTCLDISYSEMAIQKLWAGYNSAFNKLVLSRSFCAVLLQPKGAMEEGSSTMTDCNAHDQTVQTACDPERAPQLRPPP